MGSYTDNFNYKYINDAFYGGIGLSEFEVDLIDTPVFQRLRHLNQLGMSSYVFPCGEHSRFVHSLGVLFIMGRMCNHLLDSHSIDLKDIIKLRCAALLHDIGQFPLSHLGESVYGYMEMVSTVAEIKFGEGSIPKDKSISLMSKLTKYSEKHADHEKLGKYIIMNNDQISGLLKSAELDPIEIGNIVTGEIGPSKPIYSQLLHSSLDADRLDYLLRDSAQTGVKYGMVDLDYIIRLMKVADFKYRDEALNEIKINIIAFNKKGQHALEHFLMSRYFHYSQVIGHKTTTAFESITKLLYYILISKHKFVFNSIQDIRDNINKPGFLNFTDETLFKAFDDFYEETDDMQFKDFYWSVKCRIRPRTVIDEKDLINKNMKPLVFSNERYRYLNKIMKSASVPCEEICRLLEIDTEYLAYKEFSVNVECLTTGNSPDYLSSEEFAQSDFINAVKLVDKDGSVSFLALDKASIINKLTDYSSIAFYVFYVERHDKDKDELDQIFESAKNYISSLGTVMQ